MVAIQADQKLVAAGKYQAQFKGRLFNRQTGEFLHMGGLDVTVTLNHAWLGTRTQAQAMRRVAADAGLDLTGFRFVYRQDMDI